METLIALLSEDFLYKFLLLFARILAFVVFMPIFGHKSIPMKVRLSLALFFSIFLYSFVGFDTQSIVKNDVFLLSLLSELSLGFLAAFLFNIIFSAVRIIGDFISYATALSMATMFDPASGSNEGVVSRFLYLISLALFFETSMYEMTIVMMVKSFSMVTLGTFDVFSFNGIEFAMLEINRMFAFAFAFALPLFFISFIMDIYYGYGTKAMPAFSPFVITFQLKFALIFIFMLLGFDIFAQNFIDYFTNKFT